MLRKYTALALVLLLTSCGGNNDNQDDNSAPNNATTGPNNATTGPNNATTGPNNATTGPNNATTGPTNGTTGPETDLGFAIGVSADFVGSAYHALKLAEDAGEADETAFGSGDVAVSAQGAQAYVLDRMGGAVRVLDPEGALDGEITLDAAINPHAATAVGDRIFITGYNSAALVIAEHDGTAWTTENLSLAAYDTEDDNPEAGAILADGDHVLVVLQRLESFVGVENSQLLVFDTTDDTFAEPIDLGLKNAAAGLRPFGTDFAVGFTGDYGANDGGVVALKRNGAGDYEVGEMIVSEEDLGGDLLDFVFISDTEGLAVITLPDFSSQLWAFDTSGTVEQIETVLSPGQGGLAVSANGQHVIVGDRDPSVNAFIVFDRLDTTWQTHYAVPTALPPAGVVVF